MGAGARPYARLQRALRLGQLAAAETAARECPVIQLPDALALVLLLAQNHDRRFERAALRWIQRAIDEAPRGSLAAVSALATALDGLEGLEDHVARSRLSLALGQLGLSEEARVADATIGR